MGKINAGPEVDECDAARDYAAVHEALIEGQRAGRLGLGAGLNPYQPGTQDYADWMRGFQTTSAQRAAAMAQERARKCRYTTRLCDCGGRGLCLDVA